MQEPRIPSILQIARDRLKHVQLINKFGKKIRKNINDTSAITTEVYKSSNHKCEHKKDSMVSIKNEPKSISSSIYATYASDQVPNNEGILTEKKIITYLEQQM
uniref:Uncharacterized protein n=1 Tax=Populus davidiana TaxID=266767 RepID=A0A6M2EMF1_9ROSI